MYSLVFRPKPNWTALILELTGNAPGQYHRRGFCAYAPRQRVEADRRLQDSLNEDEYEKALGVDQHTGLHRYRITII
jgi:hypothetical protein